MVSSGGTLCYSQAGFIAVCQFSGITMTRHVFRISFICYKWYNMSHGSVCRSWKKEILEHVWGVEKYWYISLWSWDLHSLCCKVVRFIVQVYYKGCTIFPSNPYRCSPTSHRFDGCLELPSLSHWNSSGWAMNERTSVYSYGKAIIHGWPPFHGREQILDPERFPWRGCPVPRATQGRSLWPDEQKIWGGAVRFSSAFAELLYFKTSCALCFTSSLGPTLVWSQMGRDLYLCVTISKGSDPAVPQLDWGV